jgi:hypothetical protein
LSQISHAISCSFNALLAESLYTVKSGDNTFVLTPDRGTDAKACALLSMGWSTVFIKNSVLANRLPGTALLLRGDGKHYFIKIGNPDDSGMIRDEITPRWMRDLAGSSLKPLNQLIIPRRFVVR